MIKKYLAKIIATDNEGLQLISACCAGAKIKIADIKYLQKNKVFLLPLKRFNLDSKDKEKKVNSFCKFEFINSVKSKNIKQDDTKLSLELIAMDVLKHNENHEINLIFEKNAYITLSMEIIEVTLEDQNEII